MGGSRLGTFDTVCATVAVSVRAHHTVGLSVQSSLGKSPLVPSVLGFLLFFACRCRSGVPLKDDFKYVCAWILSLLQLLHEVRPERQHAPSSSACLHMIHSLAQLAGARATKSAEWPSKNLHWHGLQSLRIYMCPAYKVPCFITERNSIAPVRGPSHLIALEVIIHS